MSNKIFIYLTLGKRRRSGGGGESWQTHTPPPNASADAQLEPSEPSTEKSVDPSSLLHHEIPFSRLKWVGSTRKILLLGIIIRVFAKEMLVPFLPFFPVF